MTRNILDLPLASPDPRDIRDPWILSSSDADAIAVTILPWVRRVRRFTTGCALQLMGFDFRSVGTRPHLVTKLEQALFMLHCVRTPPHLGDPGWWNFPDKIRELPSGPGTITAEGLARPGDPPAPPPQASQVDVCKEWLREHARPTKQLNRGEKYHAVQLARVVSHWTKVTGAYADVEQVDEMTGETYVAPAVHISPGAFMQAALEEGYHVVRINQTRNTRSNMNVRQTGRGWRGRPVSKEGGGPVRPVKAGDVMSLETVLPKLSKFLTLRRQAAVKKEELPIFTLEEAMEACGLSYPGGRPPDVISNALEVSGCVKQRVELRMGIKSQRWYRVSDMPPDFDKPGGINAFNRQEAEEQAEIAQEARARELPWLERLRLWLEAAPAPFTIAEVGEKVLGLSASDTERQAKKISYALREAGCERVSRRVDGRAKRLWLPKHLRGVA